MNMACELALPLIMPRKSSSLHAIVQSAFAAAPLAILPAFKSIVQISTPLSPLMSHCSMWRAIEIK